MYYLALDYNDSQTEPYGGFYIYYSTERIDFEKIVKDAEKLGLSRDENGDVLIDLQVTAAYGKEYITGCLEDRIAVFKSNNIARDIRLALYACQALDEWILDVHDWTEYFELLEDRLDVRELFESEDPLMKKEFDGYPEMIEEMRICERQSINEELEWLLEQSK